MNTQNLFVKIIRYLFDADYRFMVNSSRFGMYREMPDDEYLKRMYRFKMGTELNLDNPQSF